MYRSICTELFSGMTLLDMLDRVRTYGLRAVELTSGGWGSCPFIPSAAALTGDSVGLANFQSIFSDRGMYISALNCSGNPLCPSALGEIHSKTAYDTAVLAGKLGVKTIVMMSGLPAGGPEDRTPNWITSTVSWPDYMTESLRYQWEDVALPWWRKFLSFAQTQGIEHVAVEPHPGQLVYNPASFLRLFHGVNTAAPGVLGVNLDPSHLFALGADPIVAARALQGHICYIHGKDTRMERLLSHINGLVEPLPVECVAERAWNYVAVGCGHDLQWWREFFSVVRMGGYNGAISLEMEDLTMSAEAGIAISLQTLAQAISE